MLDAQGLDVAVIVACVTYLLRVYCRSIVLVAWFSVLLWIGIVAAIGVTISRISGT